MIYLENMYEPNYTIYENINQTIFPQKYMYSISYIG